MNELNIGSCIRKRRKQLGMTQEELAQRAGYSDRSMISYIEKGNRDISLSRIIALAEALNIHPKDLIGW